MVRIVDTMSEGRTKSYVDEMGVFGCPAMSDWDSVLDHAPGRFDFWNPRAAWFAAVYAELAALGVEAMGSSQYFGYPLTAGKANDWPCAIGGNLCYYPCLSAVDWDTGKPNARWHTIKLLVDELAGDAVKIVSPAKVSEAPPPPSPPGPPPRQPSTCKAVQTLNNSDSFGGDLCEIQMPAGKLTVDCSHPSSHTNIYRNIGCRRKHRGLRG